MKLSRRKFMKAGFIATACAGLPLKFAKAATDPKGPRVPLTPNPAPVVQPPPAALPQTPAGNQELLNYYTKATFDPYISTKFRVHLGPSNTRTLTLVQTEDYLKSLPEDVKHTLGEECFSLLLTSPPGKPFQQGTYEIEHPALGTFPMFLAAVSEHTKTSPDYYEAVVYRLQQYFGSQDPTIVTETWTNPNPKEDRDTFNIGLLTNGTPAASTQTKSPSDIRRVTSRLTMAQAPVIGGLRLGMTTEQVLALFPGSETDEEVRSSLSTPPSRFGQSSLIIKPEKYSSKSSFDQVSQIIITLLDGRVSTLYVGYNGPVWEDVDEFVTKFSEGRNLPAADYWEAYVGMDTQLKTLKGKDFEISLFAGGKNVNINYVQMSDVAAKLTLKERKAKAKEIAGS